MQRTLGVFLRAAVVSSLLCLPAMAAGPINGELGAAWWANDFDTRLGSESVSDDAGAPGFRGELWVFTDYGVRAAMYESAPKDFENETTYTSVDLMWKAFAPTENNYFALGLGWEDTDLAGIDTAGARVSVEGQVSLVKVVHAYGQATYLPQMDDSNVSPDLSLEEMDGHELEVGIAWNAAPMLNVRAAYRETVIDFTQVDALLVSETDGSTESKGFLVGVGMRF
jgi:hypothetical protein